MKKLLVKGLMVMSILGILLSVQSIQPASADNDCDIDSNSIKVIDSRTISFVIDSKACTPWNGVVDLAVYGRGSNTLRGLASFTNPRADNVQVLLFLFSNRPLEKGKTYNLVMTVNDVWQDTDSFHVSSLP